eukprot:4401192-Pleurochrysis_carterae.AAC.2
MAIRVTARTCTSARARTCRYMHRRAFVHFVIVCTCLGSHAGIAGALSTRVICSIVLAQAHAPSNARARGGSRGGGGGGVGVRVRVHARARSRLRAHGVLRLFCLGRRGGQQHPRGLCVGFVREGERRRRSLAQRTQPEIDARRRRDQMRAEHLRRIGDGLDYVLLVIR